MYQLVKQTYIEYNVAKPFKSRFYYSTNKDTAFLKESRDR
jgi:hypothetical protein